MRLDDGDGEDGGQQLVEIQIYDFRAHDFLLVSLSLSLSLSLTHSLSAVIATRCKIIGLGMKYSSFALLSET